MQSLKYLKAKNIKNMHHKFRYKHKYIHRNG